MEQTYSNAFNTISTLQWKGLKSQKFRGSRSHKNHPTNQLNFLLQSNKTDKYLTGRKHFEQIITIGSQQIKKPHLRTYDFKYDSKIINFPIQKKLIKIETLKESNQSLTLRSNSVGMSKMKALQRGDKKTGIYRNFYKSIANCKPKQTKSSVIFPHLQYQFTQ